jgi:hypothetical protein
MKPILALLGLTLAVCAPGIAQEYGDRIVVPARGSSRQRTVSCTLLNGAITVKTHSGNDVLVEGEHHDHEEYQGGMHRIGGSTRGLEVVEDGDTITIHNQNGNGAVTITVPVETSLKLHTLSGGIDVEGVHGELDVHSHNGHLTLTNISGSVSADSLNGPIKVTMDSVNSTKPLSFSTLNGPVDVTLPADLKANLTVKTNHGAVYSDFDVTLGARHGTIGRDMRVDNTINGTINGGGVDLAIHTLNGAVYIRKRK